MRGALLSIFALFALNNVFGQQTALHAAPPAPIVTLQNTSDSGRCNKVKLLFKVQGTESVKLYIREDSAGVQGKWYSNTSNPRAKDADYNRLKENCDYDFKVEAINQYGKTESQVLTRHKCR